MSGVRHKGGVTLIWALVWNVGKEIGELMIREKLKWGDRKSESTEAGLRGGLTRSSEEVPVMGRERRS
ncbi:MAG: hypothetical protein Q8Q33_06425 [Chlamydiota bacterium]|nr:hypothetical protein [Chlamydiota bacterium]